MVAVILLNLWLAGGIASQGALLGTGFYVAAILIAWRGLHGFPHALIGLCNTVTVFRLALVSALIAVLFTPATGPWPVFWVALLALSLDGVDGWLARRDGRVSDFGARFDMEVDAALALVLALHAFWGGQVGPLIILLGLPRYIFWVAQFPMPWLEGALPDRFSRKLVCVMQIAVLIAVLPPVLGRPVTDILACIAAVALVWSFWRDVMWLRQARL